MHIQASKTGALTVTRLETRPQLAALEAEWEALLEVTDVASPFLTPGWQSAWLDTYGSRHRLFVLVARRGDRTVGLWPLGITRRGPFRVLEPLGAGRSDWLDIPAVPDEREEVVAAFGAYLSTHRCAWDLIELRDMLEESPTLQLLLALGQTGPLRVRRQFRTVAPYLALAGTWEQFLGSKRGKFRSNLKYYRRLPERDGHRLSIQRIEWGDGVRHVEDLAAIERRSWKAKDGNLKVSTESGQKFYRGFCSYFSARGWLEVWRADIDDAPVAFILNVIYRGKCYHYNTSYEEKSAYISPGVLLHADAISDAFGRGLTEYDFLSGDEPYKERWCSARRSIDHLVFSHAHPVSVAARAVLVDLRWAVRRSKLLSAGRQRVLSMMRKAFRRGQTDKS